MSCDASIVAAEAVLLHHINSLNAGEEESIAATLHFPHFRLSGATLKTWETSDTYFRDFRSRAGSNWGRSEFRDIRVLQAAADKVHFDLEVVRFDCAGAEILKFRSLWVITLEGGRWAAKFRSSFAPL